MFAEEIGADGCSLESAKHPMLVECQCSPELETPVSRIARLTQ